MLYTLVHYLFFTNVLKTRINILNSGPQSKTQGPGNENPLFIVAMPEKRGQKAGARS